MTDISLQMIDPTNTSKMEMKMNLSRMKTKNLEFQLYRAGMGEFESMHLQEQDDLIGCGKWLKVEDVPLARRLNELSSGYHLPSLDRTKMSGDIQYAENLHRRYWNKKDLEQ